MLYTYLKLVKIQDPSFIQFILLQVFMNRVKLDLESAIKMVGSLNQIKILESRYDAKISDEKKN